MADYSGQFDNMFSFMDKTPPKKPAAPSEQPPPAPPVQEPVSGPAPAPEAPAPVKQEKPSQDVSEEPAEAEVREPEPLRTAAGGDEPVPEAGPTQVPEAVQEPGPEDTAEPVQAPEAKPPAKPAVPRPRIVASPDDEDKLSRVELPKTMVSAVRAAFPNAANRNEAVAAYIYTMMGREGPVPERIKELSAQYPEDDRVIDLQAKLKALAEATHDANTSLSDRVKTLQATVNQVLTLLVWVVGERAGSQMDLSASADRLDFLFPDNEIIRARSAKQSAEFDDRAAHRAGLETSRRVNQFRDMKSRRPGAGSDSGSGTGPSGGLTSPGGSRYG